MGLSLPSAALAFRFLGSDQPPLTGPLSVRGFLSPKTLYHVRNMHAYRRLRGLPLFTGTATFTVQKKAGGARVAVRKAVQCPVAFPKGKG